MAMGTSDGRVRVSSGDVERMKRGSLLGPVARLGLAMGAMVALGASAASCSLIVDTNADQCKADGDCKSFPGRSCQDGVCVPDKPCSTDADCSSLPGGKC